MWTLRFLVWLDLSIRSSSKESMVDKTDILEWLYADMEQDFKTGDRGDVLGNILKVLDGRLERTFGTGTYPAVDFASGKGNFPVAYAHRYSFLEWYPTEYIGTTSPGFELGRLSDPIANFSWLLIGATPVDQREQSLFTDADGNTVRVGDMVQLNGLSKKQFYNGKYGMVQSLDPSTDGRVAVRPIQSQTSISLKQSNLNLVTCQKPRMGLHQPEVIRGLMERTRLFDLLDRETWSNVEDLNGRCALVTCSNLLTCLGYREPTIWKNCLEAASRLLTPGGYFLQYDTKRFGKFSHGKTMKRFVEETSLGLVLEGRTETQASAHGRMFIMLWRKEGETT